MKYIPLLLFTLCVSAQLSAQQKAILSDSGNYCLWYDNLFSSDSVLVSFILNNRNQESNISSIPTSYENMIHIKKNIRVPEFVLGHLLNYNSVIQSLTESTKQNKIENNIKEKICYYCGQVKISKKFDSHLFILQHNNSRQNTEDEEIIIDDKMILVNLLGNKITSISCMLSYFCWDGILTYSQIDSYKKNDYLFVSSKEDGDIVIKNDSESYYRKDEVRFKFTDMGQIIIIPLKQ